MKAEYVRLLSNRYMQLNSRELNDPVRHLYTFMYPQIYNSVRRGLSSVNVMKCPPEDVIEILVEDGFRVYPRDSDCTIDWSSPTIFSHTGRILIGDTKI